MLSTKKLSNETLDQLFRRLKAEDIEQFYMAYQLWSQRQQIEQLQLQMLDLQRKIEENMVSMEQFQPSAVALASLAQLQACGVEDIDLLDKMLERGEEWLDHSIQLLERCEQLDLIGGDYTQWCEHALEGAYDWIDSMTDPNLEEIDTATSEKQKSTGENMAEVTEEQLLKKLMSEDEESSNQESPLTNIEENETTMPDSTEQIHEMAPLSSQTADAEEQKADETASSDQTIRNSNGNSVTNRRDTKSQPPQHLQDGSSSKKRTSQTKKGFLSRLLSKFRKA
jgi:hypothetical protein